MITGLRTETFAKLQLNAGLFIKNFDYSTYKTASALKDAIKTEIQDGTNLLGATRGGGSFTSTPEVREIEADGKRYAFIGSTVIDSVDVRMTGTLLEITPDNFKTVFATADTSTSGQVTTMTIRTDLTDSDYIQSLVWIGDTSKGYVLIDLKNALNISGVNFTFTDKGEGTLPFEFQAHQDAVEDYDSAPCKILFFDSTATASNQEAVKQTE